MNRRTALKQVGLLTAGAMLVPACVRKVNEATVALKNIAITGDQEALLADIVGTFIPATDTPGAKELDIHKYVLRMVDDCQDRESQQHFVTGLGQVDESTETRFDKTFSDCTTEERITLFGELEEKKTPEKMGDGKESQLYALYSIVKRYAIQGYLSSEYIMTNVLVYNMVPGRFDGCIEIKDENDIQNVIG